MLETLQGFLPVIITTLGVIITFIVGLAVWKNNKQHTDDNQNTALEVQAKRIEAVENANKEISRSLQKISTMLELQHKDIDNLKKESLETDKSLSKMQKTLETISTIPNKLESLEKQLYLTIESFERLFEEKINNMKEKVEQVKPVQKQRFVSKLKGKTL